MNDGVDRECNEYDDDDDHPLLCRVFQIVTVA